MDSSQILDQHELIAFVAVRDPEAAEAFYSGTLGLDLVSRELPFALVFNARGTMLRVAINPQAAPIPGTVLGWKVGDIDSAVRGLAGRGVAFTRYGFLQQDSLGIWQSPNGARIAWFSDPDGNVLSLTQFPA